MICTSSMRLRRGSAWAVVVIALSLSACGGKEEAPSPAAPATPPATTPAADVPAVVDEAGGEAMLIQPSLVDTLSVDELLVRADEAMKERQLFVPAGESAFEMYLSVIEQEPVHVRARNALSDLFPYAVLYVEQRTAAGDLAEGERVLDMMERADSRAPALPRLQRAVDSLRDRVAAEAQREAQRLAAQAAAAAAPPVSVPQPTPAPPPVSAPVASTPPPQETPATQPDPTPVASVPTPAPATPPPAATPAPPPAAAPAQVTPTVISSVQPRYPPVALRRRVEGSVEVGFTIMPDGSVSNVRVVSSRPSNTFDREAINAMERWRFTPPGRQVESRRVFDFKLSD